MIHRLLVLLLAATAVPPTGADPLPGTGLSDPQRAEEAVDAAIRELEEVVGHELLEADPPPLPVVGKIHAEDGEYERMRELYHRPLAAWTEADEAWLLGLVDRNRGVLAALQEPGEPMEAEPEKTLESTPSLLHAARLAGLRDRLAWQHGDVAAFKAGLELRLELARKLTLQPLMIAPLIGRALLSALLGEVQLAALDPGTSRDLLEHLDGLLLRWQRAPDAATVLAREAIWSLEETRRRDVQGTWGWVTPGPGTALIAPAARDFAFLARGCRKEGCRPTIEALQRRMQTEDDPSFSKMLLPNYFDFLEEREVIDEVVELARAALALRRLAGEEGAYPGSLKRLPAELAAGRGDLPGLRYLPHGPDGARLSLPAAERVSPWPPGSRGQEWIARLLVWELPPLGE